MTDKNLIQKLHNLQNIKPNAEWLSENRELLCKQVSNSSNYKLSTWEVFFINFKCFAQTSTRPVFALGVFLLVLVVSSIFSHQLFTEAKPNDSLYIARVISEKARLNTVLDVEERDKMAVKFATSHAKDINAVLADPSFNTEDNQDMVAKLNESFNKEVEIARSKIEKINNRQLVANQNNINTTQIVSTTSEAEVVNTENNFDNDIVSIASDDDSISEQGIEIISNNNNTVSDNNSEIIPANNKSTLDMPAINDDLPPTTTEIESATNSPMHSLDEVKELFEKKDYNNVNSKLEEINELLK